MEYLPAESYASWKAELREGRADAGFSAQVGKILGRIHAATSHRPEVAAAFPTDFTFHSIRLEPYLEATALVHPDLASRLLDLAKPPLRRNRPGPWRCESEKHFRRTIRSRAPRRRVLLVRRSGLRSRILPESPAAQCLWTPAASTGFLICFETMHDAYMNQVTWEPAGVSKRGPPRFCPALFLARVDGKSPVEYLTAADQDRVRRVGPPPDPAAARASDRPPDLGRGAFQCLTADRSHHRTPRVGFSAAGRPSKSNSSCFRRHRPRNRARGCIHRIGRSSGFARRRRPLRRA